MKPLPLSNEEFLMAIYLSDGISLPTIKKRLLESVNGKIRKYSEYELEPSKEISRAERDALKLIELFQKNSDELKRFQEKVNKMAPELSFTLPDIAPKTIQKPTEPPR